MSAVDRVRHYQNEMVTPLTALQKMPEHEPEMLLIGCVDARIRTSDLGIPSGSALIHRNIAALVPPKSDADTGAGLSTEAALEFAINVKGVKDLVVMGHTDCGGCAACVAGQFDASTDAVRRYLQPLSGKRDEVISRGGDAREQARALEEEAVRHSLANLMTYPCVQKAVEEGRVKLHGWIADTRTHMIAELDKEKDQFMPMVDPGRTWQLRHRNGGQPAGRFFP